MIISIIIIIIIYFIDMTMIMIKYMLLINSAAAYDDLDALLAQLLARRRPHEGPERRLSFERIQVNVHE